MKSIVLSCERVEKIDMSKLPSGRYEGKWGGYEIDVDIEGIEYRMRTEIGIRTFGAPCIVIVENGTVSVV